MDDATKHLLAEAREEIIALRRRNELLSAKVEMIDLFAMVLHTRPAYDQQGMGEDVAWKIGRALAEDNAEAANMAAMQAMAARGRTTAEGLRREAERERERVIEASIKAYAEGGPIGHPNGILGDRGPLPGCPACNAPEGYQHAKGCQAGAAARAEAQAEREEP